MIKFKVPEDVTVMGVDNDTMICDLSDPPLTSIVLNIESAGYEAAALMDNMIKKKKPIEKQIIVSPTHNFQRQSSNILAVDDNDVAIAIRYIMENAKNKILIKDIVSITNSGRRKLEKQFRKMIHRSILPGNKTNSHRIDIKVVIGNRNVCISNCFIVYLYRC